MVLGSEGGILQTGHREIEEQRPEVHRHVGGKWSRRVGGQWSVRVGGKWGGRVCE